MVDVNISVKINPVAFNISLNNSVNNQKLVNFTDANGTDAQVWKDVDGFTVAKIDSKGNLKIRGSVGKI